MACDNILCEARHLYTLLIFHVSSQMSSVRTWKLPVKLPPVLRTQPKTRATWGRNRCVRREVELLLQAERGCAFCNKGIEGGVVNMMHMFFCFLI